MKRIIGVRISDMTTGEGYIARNVNECHDAIDADVFNLVHEHDNGIGMGCMCGEPIYG